MRHGLLTTSALALTLTACGGGTTEQTTTTTTARRTREPTAEEQAQADAQAGVQIEGLMGTISQRQVNDTLQPRVESAFGPCFAHASDVHFLFGSIRLAFRIHTDGSVAWVYPSETTLGHRDVERCIADRAHGIHFPRPRGGEAEFSWEFHYDAPTDIRPPLSWDAARIATLLSSNGGSLVSQCGGQRGYRVTAYVQSGGAVMSVGVAAQSTEAAAQLDCIANGVSGWRMPDPGSYPAKITFDL
ncbi:MAG: AgmX/PglI C-terminal domain-containing protein [Sandaracinaceae bacterium]|jgi:hypothetical protein|nr:AgmX/PglI C-terminal domain-containing protein [Sandaracinaceae bacterium]